MEKTNKKITSTDFLYFALVILGLAATVMLTNHTMREAQRTETAKREVERLAEWLTKAGEARAKKESSGIDACDPPSEWAACQEALLNKEGPIGGLHNVIEDDGLIVAETCDKEKSETHGAYIIENGVPPGPGLPPAWAAITADTKLDAPLTLRVFVCGRSFHKIPVAEIKY